MTVEPAFVDLHCHTAASFDSLADPVAVARTAAARGLTHLAITDHGTIEGALRARDAAAADVEILVGEEIRTIEGDLIAVFLERAIPNGLPASEAIAAVRDQGGLVGIPHPYDRFRGSMGKSGGRTAGKDAATAGAAGGAGPDALTALSASVDWIEAWNARIIFGDGNERAAALVQATGRPGVAVSDAHTTMEVGVASTILDGDPSTAAGLRAALAAGVRLHIGRASFYTRLATPFAKLVKRARR
jgi:predicted metal-dependent phosphoesterase TrpH